MTTITLEPARTDKSMSIRHSRYLLQFAMEIAEDLPAIAVIVRYGYDAADKLCLNEHHCEVELFV